MKTRAPAMGAREDRRSSAGRHSSPQPAGVVIADARAEAADQRHLARAVEQAPRSRRQRALATGVQDSAAMLVQRKRIEGAFGLPVQRQAPEEEEDLQMKTGPGVLQRQGLEEEELFQGRFDPLQRQGAEDEALLQGKGAPRSGPILLAQAPSATSRTGLPDNLKAGIEALSGMDMSDVRVHGNSPEPAQLDALAYAQGNDIHLAAGQDAHLPHEAWHLVQQRQGRVKPTMQARGVQINDDTALEKEADVMGERALQMRLPARNSAGPATRAATARQHARVPTEASHGASAATGASGEKGLLNFLSTAAPVQRTRERAVVTKHSGAGIHKSNRKKVASGEATDLNVRSGGIFRTGIKVTVPKGTVILVDYARLSADGQYIWARYVDDSGRTWVGYVNSTNVQRESAEVEEDQDIEQVRRDMALADGLLSPYLKTHVIGQHLGEEVTNRKVLVEQGLKKAEQSETWAIRELGIGEKRREGASQSEREKGEEKKQLLKNTKDALIELLIEADPTEEPFRDVYKGPETGKLDLVNMLVAKRGRDAKRSTGKYGAIQEEVYSKAEFWVKKGKELLEEPMGTILGGPSQGKTPIWCDQSTAIIFATLADNPGFKSPLEVVKQGDPKQHGHWYVLANRDPDAPSPAWGETLQGNEFIIDIWGTLRLNEPTWDDDAEVWVTPKQYESVVHWTANPAILNAAVNKERVEAENALVILARASGK